MEQLNFELWNSIRQLIVLKRLQISKPVKNKQLSTPALIGSGVKVWVTHQKIGGSSLSSAKLTPWGTWALPITLSAPRSVHHDWPCAPLNKLRVEPGVHFMKFCCCTQKANRNSLAWELILAVSQHILRPAADNKVLQSYTASCDVSSYGVAEGKTDFTQLACIHMLFSVPKHDGCIVFG